jgi:hypothetical protein
LIFWSAAALLLVTMSGAGDSAPKSPQDTATQAPQYRRVVRERIVVRVPAPDGQVTRAPVPLVWQEGRGPRCIRAKAIAGARIRGRSSVDVILKNQRRFRARLAYSCPALDYYFGFYIVPNPDGLVCVDRDVIRSRVGGQCGIEAFRSLRPVQRVAQRQ